MRPDRSWSARRAAVVLSLVGGLALAGCANGGVPAPTSTGDPTPDVTTLGATPSTEPSARPSSGTSDITVPVRCEDIYSSSMLALLEAGNPPLNDPGVTMDSTEVVEALEVLASGVPTLRCSWGLPSSYGLATNVSIVTADQAQRVLAALAERGFSCADLSQGTVCRAEGGDQENAFGETHYLRGNGWIATRWINFGPAGYTEDVISTLWE